MVKSTAVSVSAYLAELPEERRAVIAPLRDLIVRHLPPGYVETMNWGMICYEVPLERYAGTSNGQPLGYAALAAQKNAYSLYLMSLCEGSAREQTLRDAFREAGKKLDFGKSCVRFKRLQDLPLEALAALIASTPVETFVAEHEAARAAAARAKKA
ncbi:MAG TPA: DUF1801 domain-containing protein [Dokdonella sp.]|uniref:DUF1801 domain-containing protein n=1 Tax=Dokdonella sp. TaxID=2291710 RepID=UPI002C612B76|nr:DUF1801 domain-containing protein [Dokdonella sp.]HUD41216.1 DUF1801 domain-containing protein [Dokdonella sp.]